MRLVFCGTPRFAVPTLQQLLRAGHSVELVITQPDRPAGRGRDLSPPAVKLLANQARVPLIQPEKIKSNPELAARLASIQSDAIIVVAYGRILPKWMLDLPPLGCLNLHASLLPKYRGAAPIQWAIANGETVTGATIMRIDEGLDTGEILLQSELPIAPDQTAADLAPPLSELGATLMLETLERLQPGADLPLCPVAQDDSASSQAPVLRREDALVDFSHSPREVYNRWRGFQPWPGAYTFFRNKKLTLHRLAPASRRSAEAAPGEIAVEGERMFAAARGGWLELLEVQLEGRRRLPVAEFLCGAALRVRERLGE